MAEEIVIPDMLQDWITETDAALQRGETPPPELHLGGGKFTYLYDPERKYYRRAWILQKTHVHILWLPGSFTAIHDHNIPGRYALLVGTLRENRYVKKADDTLSPIGSVTHQPGIWAAEEVDIIHEMVNEGGKAITLHEYDGENLDMCTWPKNRVNLA